MAVTAGAPAAIAESPRAPATVMAILVAISLGHFTNDTLQSLIPAIYPMLKDDFGLSFAQIGAITLVFQATASLLQPVVGLVTDRRPQPFSLPVGMASTLIGLVTLGFATSYAMLLAGAALVGIGSSIFHPEASRVARMAAGRRTGFAQSLFQLGGNFGTALGPLLAAFIVLPNGQKSVAAFAALAALGMTLLYRVGRWYESNRPLVGAGSRHREGAPLSRRTVVSAVTVLVVLMFSKMIYTACLGNYFTFYMIDQFGVGTQAAQLHLFVFLFSQAAGTFLGGPIGDRIGRKRVIWASILGALPFTLALPFADITWTPILAGIAGFIMASAFSAIIVYGQDLLPGRVGLVSGLFFGLAFGAGAIGAAALGLLADATSIRFVFLVCSALPAIGLLTIFLPDIRSGGLPARA